MKEFENNVLKYLKIEDDMYNKSKQYYDKQLKKYNKEGVIDINLVYKELDYIYPTKLTIEHENNIDEKSIDITACISVDPKIYNIEFKNISTNFYLVDEKGNKTSFDIKNYDYFSKNKIYPICGKATINDIDFTKENTAMVLADLSFGYWRIKL